MPDPTALTPEQLTIVAVCKKVMSYFPEAKDMEECYHSIARVQVQLTTAQQRSQALGTAIEKFLHDVDVLPPWQSAGALWAVRLKELHAAWVDAKED